MTQPDFIIIPTPLLSNENLQPSDRILFGYIYWMTKLALMKCVASNMTLSKLTGLSQRTIQVGLERLEKAGYVRRIFSDEASRHRLEIVCTLAFSAIKPKNSPTLRTNVQGATHKRAQGLRTNVPHNKKSKEKENIKRKGNQKIEDLGSILDGQGHAFAEEVYRKLKARKASNGKNRTGDDSDSPGL